MNDGQQGLHEYRIDELHKAFQETKRNLAEINQSLKDILLAEQRHAASLARVFEALGKHDTDVSDVRKALKDDSAEHRSAIAKLSERVQQIELWRESAKWPIGLIYTAAAGALALLLLLVWQQVQKMMTS